MNHLIYIFLCALPIIRASRENVHDFILKSNEIIYNQKHIEEEVFQEFFSSAFVSHTPIDKLEYAPAGIKYNGRGGNLFKEELQELFVTFPDLKREIIDIVVSERNYGITPRRSSDNYQGQEYEVVFQWTMRGSHLGCSWFMESVTNERIHLRGFTYAIVKYEEDKGYTFNEEWTISDTYDLLSQLNILSFNLVNGGNSFSSRQLQLQVEGKQQDNILKLAIEDGDEDEGVSKAILKVKKCIKLLWNYKELSNANVQDCLSPDFTSSDNYREVKGRREFVDYVKDRHNAFSNGVWYVDSAVGALSQGSLDTYKVGIRYSFHGNNDGDGYLSLSATSKKVTTGGIAIYTLKDDKITHVQDIHDVHNTLAQLGHIQKKPFSCNGVKRSERDIQIDRRLKEQKRNNEGRMGGENFVYKEL